MLLQSSHFDPPRSPISYSQRIIRAVLEEGTIVVNVVVEREQRYQKPSSRFLRNEGKSN